MKKGKVNNGKFRVSRSVIIVTFFLFLVLILRLCYLCLVDYNVGDETISMFIKNRNTKEEVIMPKRGTIYDTNGNVLANDVVSYTLVAYLSDKRVNANGDSDYVSDIDSTSDKLASILGVESSSIREILTNGKNNNKYQVEFGSMGKGISELTKELIANLNLPGIGFTKEIKRYYQNGNFASYLIGYTVTKEDDDGNKWITGEMGIEEYYNKELSGKSGYVTYEKDKYGYKIANGREYSEPATDGNDIYLTIDNNIQLFVENAVSSSEESSKAEWTLMVVMDAKSGAILGYSSSPSFDPNIRNITSYLDPIVNQAYEPGSTMKVFSYLCAVDSGKYDGSTTYTSGSKSYTSETDGKSVTISDWKKEGWGNITYDEGFALSSNIAVANIVESVITKEELKSCYAKYGFGKATGITLKREDKGSIDYRYQIEAATAGYGQGITTTPMQHLQALTAISNDGVMLRPYIVDKITLANSKEVIYTGKRTVVGTVASSESISKMKELMRSVINGDESNSTGYLYYMDGYDLIGKTGTAQIYDYTKGSYMTGDSDYIYSFSGMFPGDDPEIIIYAAVKLPKDKTNYIAPMVKEVEKNITKYLNIENSSSNGNSYVIDSYLNKSVSEVESLLKSDNLRVVVIGNGDRVINQYPSSNSIVYDNDLVILKSNSFDNKMIDLSNYSYKEVINILNFMGIRYEIEGSGYVYEQSIGADSIIGDDDTLIIKLKDKW